MTPAEMLTDIPYIVTRGSSWAELRRGDRVEWVRDPNVVWSSVDAYSMLKVTRKATEYRWGLTRGEGAWQVELDRAGIMERVAKLRKDADRLEAFLE